MKFVVLLVLAVLAFVQGAVAQYLFPGAAFPRSDLFFLLPQSVLAFVWYRLDSGDRAYKRSAWLNIGVVAIELLALHAAERAILLALMPWRIRGQSNRRTEWLAGIPAAEATQRALAALRAAGIPFSLPEPRHGAA